MSEPSDSPDAASAAELGLDTLAAAAEVAGLEFSADERELMLDAVRKQIAGYRALREVAPGNEVAPALRFDPRLPDGTVERELPRLGRPPEGETPTRPADLEEVAFWPLTRLARLLRGGEVSSLELTRLYLDRLRRYDPTLRCVVTLTEARALEAAERADRELAAGLDRGPLHGIPYGAKDLLALPGYPTTWGATPYREQRLDDTATVIERLDEAGAVLVAKLSLGALAMGDVWFGGTTRNPWNPEEGSSGSSAGSAAAVAAGLVGFAIGSETMGSIVSPATRCAVTGLRPTANRVSRHGAMALAWSMDKIGPMARSVEDCALVLSAIYGPDGRDPTVADVPFEWPAGRDLRGLRVGMVEAAFAAERDTRSFDDATLEVLRGLGVEPLPIRLPEEPVEHFMIILMAEAAAAFDDLTRSGRDDELVDQRAQAWPNLMRAARLIPAVEYLQANRVRTRAMREMAALMEGIDVYLCPSSYAPNLYLTNATGHPTVAVPNGFRDGRPIPSLMTFTAGLYREADALLLAQAYQQAAGFEARPDMAKLLG